MNPTSIIELLKINSVSIILAILSAIISWIVSKFYYEKGIVEGPEEQLKVLKENQEREIRRKIKSALNTNWIWQWKTNTKGQQNHDIWVFEKVTQRLDGNTIIFENDCNKLCLNLLDTEYFYGTWQSQLSPSSKGVAVFRIDPLFKYFYGYFMDTSNIVGLGPWVIGRNERDIELAKKNIIDPNYLLKKDLVQSEYLKIFYVYHLTQMNGSNVWRHYYLNFEKNDNNEILLDIISVTNKDGQKIQYRIEAITIGSHFLLIHKRIDGREEPTISIFPHMITVNNTVSYGIVFGTNYDIEYYTGPTIISHNVPFKNLSTVGTQNASDAIILSKEWEENFIKEIKAPIKNMQNNSADFYVRGTDGIYFAVEKELKKRINDEIINITIVGYTLFSVAPKLRDWLKDHLLYKMKITIFYMDADFISDNKNLISQDWKDTLTGSLKNINAFINDNQDNFGIDGKEVSITLKPYNHIPPVHGFKLGDTYFVAVPSYEKSNYLRMPNRDIFKRVSTESVDLFGQSLKDGFDTFTAL